MYTCHWTHEAILKKNGGAKTPVGYLSQTLTPKDSQVQPRPDVHQVSGCYWKPQMHTAQRKHTARTHTGPLSPKLQQMLPLTNHYSSISTAINKPSAETSRKSFADNELVNVVCSLRLLTFLLMPFAAQTAGAKKNSSSCVCRTYKSCTSNDSHPTLSL